MKKLLIAILLLAASVGATDFCDSYGSYRNQVKRRLNVPIGTTTGIFADTVMNQIIREGLVYTTGLRKSAKIVKKVVTTKDIVSYKIDSLIIDVSSVYWSKNDSIKPLQYMPIALWPTVLEGEKDSLTGYDARPDFYNCSDTALFLAPVTSVTGDTIVVEGYRKIPSISAVDSVAVLPQKYRVIVIAYAVRAMAQALQHPMVEIFDRAFRESVTDIKNTEEGRQ